MIFIMLFVFCIGQIDELIKVRWMTRGIMLFRQPSGHTSTVYKSEAKLCDIVLYVQGRKCAYKLLLISASEYFRLFFDQEDFFLFLHLSEDWLFAVLDIWYACEIADNVSLDNTLLGAHSCNWTVLEELEAKHASSPKPRKTVCYIIKRRAKSMDKKRRCDFFGKVSATAKHLGTTEPSILVGTLS